jgi:galacturan 1,4-alpha-galacturonidase
MLTTAANVVTPKYSSAWSASRRPNYEIGPYHTGKTFPPSPLRTKTCVVLNPGCCTEGQDDSANIMLAIEQCNDGGHVVFEPGTYIIGTPLDLTFLKHIDLGM